MDEQGVFEGYASVYGVVDYDNDVVEPGACAKSIESGAAKDGVPILAQHEEHLPIGKSLELREDEKGLYIKGYISPTSTGLDYRQLVKDKVITGMSIGYIVVDSRPDAQGIRHIKEMELVEVSFVTFPANSAAQVSGYKSVNSVNSVNNEGGQKSMATPLAEVTLEDFTAAVAEAVVKGLASLTPSDGGAEQKNAPPAQEPPEGEGKPDGGKDPEEPETEKETKSASQKPEHKAATQPEVQRKYGGIYIPQPTKTDRETKELPPGIQWARCIKAMTLAKGDPEHASSIAYSMYDDTKMQREIKALTVTNPAGGGFLTPESYSNEIIPLLRAQSVVRKLGATVIPMASGNLTIPKMAGGMSAQYIGEMRKGKESQASFENIRLSSKKLLTKCIISNDLIRSASIAADKIVLEDAIDAMALRADEAALVGKGTEFEPRGLLNMSGISKLTLSVDEKITGSMIAELMSKNVDTSQLGWAFNSLVWEKFYNVTNAMGLYLYREGMDGGKLNGHPYAITPKLPVGSDAKKTVQLILGRWKDFLIGEQLGAQTEISHEGTTIMSDGSIVSALDHDCTIIRIISMHDFAMRYEEAFVVANIATA